MDVVTNSALYLFSALLQADAALLGFGAVFVVYKLQDIDNKRESLANNLRDQGSVARTIVRFLLGNQSLGDMAKKLNELKNHDSYKQYVYLASSDTYKVAVRKKLVLPVILLSGHLLSSPIAIHFVPTLSKHSRLFNYISAGSIALFCTGVILSIYSVWRIITIESKPLKVIYPELHRLLEKLPSEE